MQIIQVLLYILMATIALGIIVCSIAFVTALKSGDTGRASNLIGKAAIGLGFTTVILLIMLILIYHFKLWYLTEWRNKIFKVV